jgi:hypothetical protein
VAAAMQAAAPDLMAQVSAIRQQFPGAKLSYFRADGIELGKASAPGWKVDDHLVMRAQQVERDIAAEAARLKEEQRLNRSKQANRKRK